MLNKILLVDDDQPTNLLNSIIIDKLGCCKEVVVKERGDYALEYLKNTTENGGTPPELILLDINMPGMNGWEFLEAYKELEDHLKATVVVVMLTTSLNPKDQEKAKEAGVLSSFENKPLSKKKMADIITRYFPDIKLSL